LSNSVFPDGLLGQSTPLQRYQVEKGFTQEHPEHLPKQQAPGLQPRNGPLISQPAFPSGVPTGFVVGLAAGICNSQPKL
jgi:hypothetical protein